MGELRRNISNYSVALSIVKLEMGWNGRKEEVNEVGIIRNDRIREQQYKKEYAKAESTDEYTGEKIKSGVSC